MLTVKSEKKPTVTRIDWVRLDDGMPNNVGGPWVGQGVTASYRIDHGTDWAGLSVFGDGHGWRAGSYVVYGSVEAAKRAARTVEFVRRSELRMQSRAVAK